MATVMMHKVGGEVWSVLEQVWFGTVREFMRHQKEIRQKSAWGEKKGLEGEEEVKMRFGDQHKESHAFKEVKHGIKGMKR